MSGGGCASAMKQRAGRGQVRLARAKEGETSGPSISYRLSPRPSNTLGRPTALRDGTGPPPFPSAHLPVAGSAAGGGGAASAPAFGGGGGGWGASRCFGRYGDGIVAFSHPAAATGAGGGGGWSASWLLRAHHPRISRLLPASEFTGIGVTVSSLWSFAIGWKR